MIEKLELYQYKIDATGAGSMPTNISDVIDKLNLLISSHNELEKVQKKILDRLEKAEYIIRNLDTGSFGTQYEQMKIPPRLNH